MEVVNVELVKSANDKKQYRIIQLENGLRVMLIREDEDDEPDCETEGEDDMETGDSMTEDEMSALSGEDCSADEKKKKKYQKMDVDDEGEFSEPENEDKNDKEKKSAAALCIGVGSFSDPDDIPGFAHFLEHMVFMGSTAYPEENDFDQYLSKHGGESNACTDCETTTFFFEVQRKHFQESLHKLAHFFISPLLKKDCVDREIEAVDSEFQMSTSSDPDRVNELLATTAKKGHPMSRFMGGNAKSLRDDPKANGMDIYQRLRSFYERLYCANYMTLALMSMDSLDTLEKWAVDIFSPIPSTAIPRPTFSDLKDPFDTQQFRRFYKVVPMEDTHKLEISWALPSMVQKYREKPLDYLATLILHEGKGSILSYLKKKLYALAMSGGGEGSGYGHNSTWSLFFVAITLTAKGLQNILEVCNAVFEYIQMLQKEGPQHWIFLEQHQIEQTRFRWKEPGEPIEDVQEVVESMQVFQPEHYLAGKHLLFNYDSQLIQECTEKLRPNLANFVLLSPDKSVVEAATMKEKWYGTKYSVTDIDPDWLKTWENLTPNPELFFPEPNIYIATDFTLHPKESGTPKAPHLVVDNQFCKMWFKKDNKFNVPKGNTYIHLMSPVVAETLENATLNDLFINILLNILSESIYPAVLAGYDYWVEGFPTGIVITVEGFNHKMPQVLQCLVDHIADFQCTPDLFTAIKTQLKKAYYNEMIKPEELAKMLRFALLDPHTQPVPDRYRLISQLTHQQLYDFLANFKSKLFIEGFVIGNFKSQEVVDMTAYMQKRLCTQPLPEEQIPKKVLLELPTAQMTCRVKSVNRDDCNSCVVDYYQSGPGNLREACLNELLQTRMREPCFDFLRTKHQLGYSVFSSSMLTNGILGMSITVESQSNKHRMEDVAKLMHTFVEEFNTTLHAMKEEEFDSLVDALITSKRLEDTHLGEEASRLWKEIHDQFYVFDLLKKEIAILKTVTLQELKEWYNQFVDDRQKKLSLQVEGKTNEASGDVKVKDNAADNDMEQKETKSLVFLNPDENGKNFITNIPQIKKSLSQYPYSRVSL